MEDFFFEAFGVGPKMLNYFILPLLIFLARICDVSLSTIRIIFVMGGNKKIAPILGFFEALVWLLAIGQIIQNISNGWSYLAYAVGFATGTYVGMVIEEKLALGRVVVRLITKVPVKEFFDYLNKNDFRYSVIDAEGRRGKVNVVFTVVKREHLNLLMDGINEYHPHAFFTIEGVKKINEDINIQKTRKNLASRFGIRSRRKKGGLQKNIRS